MLAVAAVALVGTIVEINLVADAETPPHTGRGDPGSVTNHLIKGDVPPQILSKAGYELEVEDDFSGSRLNDRLWIPHYLPQWSSRSASATRYSLRDGALRLFIEAEQQPWCPEFDGWLRVSSLQTGVFSGPLGSDIGQCHFRSGLVVREEQASVALYTPRYGLFEMRARAIDDPNNMVALWMIGYEDEPERSAEICLFEIFGRDVKASRAAIGMGVHPFSDATIRDDFTREDLGIDVRVFHWYAAEWTPSYVAFYVDDRLIKVVDQSPAYPMQFMVGIYEFADAPTLRSRADRYPKEFVIDRFRGYRPTENHDRSAARAVSTQDLGDPAPDRALPGTAGQTPRRDDPGYVRHDPRDAAASG